MACQLPLRVLQIKRLRIADGRRLHKADVLRLTQELRTASTGAKGGSAAAERLKKELEKTRCELPRRSDIES